MAHWPKWVASVAFLSPPLGWRAERRYRQMPRLEINRKDREGREEKTKKALRSLRPSRFNLPSVSIIVPARNEAENLQALLPSLCRLEYPGKVEVIVVDDNSVDETAVIAQNFGVRVIKLDELPPGWLGKPHACHRGAAEATGDWLLFTDADTVHTPGGLAQAVRYALARQVDGLTFHLGHTTTSWLDSVTLLAAFAGLFAGLPREHASMNGQYILLRHDVYRKSGGFAAVRQEPLEDLALGRYLHGLGYRVPMLRGEDVAQVAMYKSHDQLWRGMSRLGAGSLRFAGSGSLLTGLFVTALMTPLLVLGLVSARRLSFRWIWLTWGTAVAGIWPWSERFGLRWRMVLAPFGALFVQLSAMWGLFSRLTGRGIRWKGRQV
ncbi:MAG: glycosyltransferase [Anaerolineae bacterium]